jgi:hypothetical protein
MSAPSQTTPNPTRRLLMRLIIVLLVLIGAVQVWQAWDEVRSAGMDLQQDYIAALRMRAGGDIFTPFSRAEIAAIGVDEAKGFGMRTNVHPPLMVLLVVPLTLLPFWAAALLWTLASVALLLWTASLLIDELGLPLAGMWRWMALLLLVDWYPVWLHMHLGQWTILLFALLVLAWRGLRRGRDDLAGGLLALAALLKIFPALLLGYALLRGRWRVLRGALAVGALVLGMQLAVRPQDWAAYAGGVASDNAAGWTGSPRNASLTSFSTRLFVGSDEVEPLVRWPAADLPARALLYTGALAVFAAALWRRRAAPDLAGEYSLFVSAMVLLSPLSWEHAYIFLLLPYGYLWQRARAEGWRRPWAVCGALSFALSLYPAETVLLAVKRVYYPAPMPALVGLLAPGAVVVLLCYVAMVLALWSTSDSAQRTPAPAGYTPPAGP